MELNELVKEFLELSPEHFRVERLDNGLINDTFLIENLQNHQKYILQKINTAVFRNPELIVENHLKINEILRENGYSGRIVQPIKNKSGKFLDSKSGQWRMQEFVPGCNTFLKVPDTEKAFLAAKAFSYFYGSLNKKTAIHLAETLPRFIDFKRRIADFQIALNNADEKLKDYAALEISFIQKNIHLPEKWIELEAQNQLPKRIIHADPKISNLLFSEAGKPFAIIDLDTVMNATLLYDFGDMVRSYTNLTDEDDGESLSNFSSEIYAEVKRGFVFHLEEILTEAEKEHLDYAAETVIFIQAVRFLTDYLSGSQYYQTRYPAHNLDRTKNQIRLLQGLHDYLK